jgi:hypothetical protein
MAFPVLISYSNNGYYDFAKNMLLNLNNTIKFHKIHFYCLDDEIYERLHKLDLTNIDVSFERVYNTNISTHFEKYGSIGYNTITHTKMDILRNALSKYNYIHFIDCDVVCIKEPTLDHYIKYKDYDIVFQYDAGFYSADALHAPTIHHIWACTGNTSFRNTPETHEILNIITEYQTKYINKNDQECLYQYFQDTSITDIQTYTPAKMCSYKPIEYTNGYWLNNNIGTLENTYFFHANHVSGYIAKIELLKKANQWFL